MKKAIWLALLRGSFRLKSNLFYSKGAQILFSDTEMIVLKIWSEHKFGRVDPFIISSSEEIDYDLYLLTDIDLPWVFDPQRENPDERSYFFEWFRRELKKKNTPMHIISGDFEQRLANACRIIDNLF